MAITFETEAQRQCHREVARWMGDIFGDVVRAHPDKPAFTMTSGSAVTTVSVAPWGNDDAIILIVSPMVKGAHITLELTEFLLEQNMRGEFGAFGLDRIKNIIFVHHAIIGSACTRNVLGVCVNGVAQTSDDYDDVVVGMFGGLRGQDMMQELFAEDQ